MKATGLAQCEPSPELLAKAKAKDHTDDAPEVRDSLQAKAKDHKDDAPEVRDGFQATTMHQKSDAKITKTMHPVANENKGKNQSRDDKAVFQDVGSNPDKQFMSPVPRAQQGKKRIFVEGTEVPFFEMDTEGDKRVCSKRRFLQPCLQIPCTCTASVFPSCVKGRRLAGAQ